MKFRYWQEEDGWHGYLEDFPDNWSQGETLEALMEHLRDLHRDLTSWQPPAGAGAGGRATDVDTDRSDRDGALTMVIDVGPESGAALNDHARRRGDAPESPALDALRMQSLAASPPFEPRDEWERGPQSLATDCGVSLDDSASDREEFDESRPT